MKIRTFDQDDAAGCLAVFDSNVPSDFRVQERADFEAFIDALPGPYWVVEEEGRVIACGGAALEAEGATAALCWGMVRRDRQGEGWGRLLTKRRLEWARTQPGVRRVALRTSQRTRGFYERMGFRAVLVISDGIAPGLDAVDMILTLPGALSGDPQPGR